MVLFDDGFVHLSAAEQVQETLRLHFPGRTIWWCLPLIRRIWARVALGSRARGGSFHYYGVLKPDQVRATFDVSADGETFSAAGPDKDCVNGHLHHIATFAVPPAAGNRP